MQRKTLAEIERDAILDTVTETGNAVEAAAILGIGKTTIYRKLREYGVKGSLLKTILRDGESQ